MLKRFSRVLAASALLAGSLAGMAHADQLREGEKYLGGGARKIEI
ncbi:hypothetical protein AAER03_13040 [Pseudomonas aeruginosa]